MTRISQSQLHRTLISDILANHLEVLRASEQVSSGYKVAKPGDSDNGATIAEFRSKIQRIEGYKNRLAPLTSLITFQDDLGQQGIDLVNRAKDLGTQAANETISDEERATMANEVFQIRDQLVALANSKYQGRYIYGGTDVDDPPYDASTYTLPASGAASQRYVYDTEDGTSTSNTVQIADGERMTVNTPGNQIFDGAMQALERLGRAMAGYRTLPTSGAPTGGGTAFTFPTDYAEQTSDIQGALDLLDTARKEDLLPERVDLGARLKRLETAGSLLDTTKKSAQDVLDALQNADSVTAITQLQQAQFALQASMQVTGQVAQLSVLDYL